jgi:colanic acid/amylovoran biosynthesis glycosyltransferase
VRRGFSVLNVASGLAIVSTRHAGIPEAVREGETGLLANEGDVGAMAEAFLEIRSKTVAFGQAGL